MLAKLQFYLFTWLEKKQQSILVEVFIPVVVGIGIGGLFLFSRNFSSKWLLATLIIFFGIVFLLLIDVAFGHKGKKIDYISKILLVIFIVDVPLGLDYAPFTQTGHQGGPAGLEISLMTFVIVIGYALWFLQRFSESSKVAIRYFPLVTVPAALFWFTNLLSIFQAQFILFSFFEMWMITQFILAYFYFINHLQTEEDLRLVLITLLVASSVQAIIMMAQYFSGFEFDIGIFKTQSQVESGTGFVRVGGTLGSPSAGGTWFMVILCVIFGIMLSKRKLVSPYLIMVALGTGAVAIVGTGSRAGWLASGMGMGIILLAGFLFSTLRRMIDSKMLILIICGGIILALLLGNTIMTRLTKDDGSAESRIPLAELAFNIIEDYPYGVGLNNYGEVMFDNRYVPPSLVGSSSIYAVHNKFLLVWAETGPWGLVAFILVLLSGMSIPVLLLFKPNIPPHLMWLSVALGVSLLGYAQNMMTEPFGTRLRTELLWVLLALLVGVYHVAIQQSEEKVTEEAKLNQPGLITAPGALN